jgi:NADH-quinone oxidoreductase subunit G
MGTVLFNGEEVEIGDDERLNAIQLAARVGEDIPHYCWHAGLSVVASCRMCLVETGRRKADTGQISMTPKLVPACQTPATDGTVFVTNSDKVKNARAMVEEDLLIDHPIDCPVCDKAGECFLQDYHFEHGRDERRADVRPFTSRRRPLGDTVTLFVDRCVMCSRCVRFTREISGTSELYVNGRGASEEIDVFDGFPLDNKMSGNVVDLCPVGALGDKDFLYQQRVWFMKSHDNVCAGCSSGCSIHVEENQDRVYRLKPRENPHVNEWWMCDEGRYGFHHVHHESRVTQPLRREGGGLVNADWSQLPAELNERLAAAENLAAVISPHLTVEEAYLLGKYARQRDPSARLVRGYVPSIGEDETFKNGFTIRAEKCPNRRGVEEVIAHFMGDVPTLDELFPEIANGRVDAVWVTGGYKKSDWIPRAAAEQLRRARLLIVQDLFPSPLSEVADYRLPAAAFTEREGSYVNVADRLQSFKWAIRPPMGVRVEGSLFWQLLGNEGMYNARSVMDEVAREIIYFAVAADEVPTVGVDLKVNMLA